MSPTPLSSPNNNSTPNLEKPVKPVQNTGAPSRMAPPLPLPFAKRRKMGFGEWIFRHRVGLLVTVIFHLSLAIVFLTYQIIIRPVSAKMLEIDMVNEEFETPKEEDVPPEQRELQYIEDVKIENRISNESSKLDATLRDNRNNKSQSSQLYEEAKRVQEALQAGNDAYEQGMNEVAAIENGGKSSSRAGKSKDNSQNDSKKGDNQRNERAKYQGNVTVSYYLPNRTDTHLYVPAYRCEGGGQVIVNITVNQNGKVIAAGIEKATSTGDNCVLEMAIQAAKATTFNVSQSAPDKQKGTITYIFIPQ